MSADRCVQPAASAIAAAIAATDYTRRSPLAIGGRGGHKEWQHFVILASGMDLLVNFSLCDDTRGVAAPGSELPRIVLIVNDGEWDGDVETFAANEVMVRGGGIDFAFARNRLVFDRGRFRLSVALRQRPVVLDLELTPVTYPAHIPSIAMLDGPPLHWTVVPRLRASGTVTVNGRTHELHDEPAYHDHNWGHFLWGHDISWEWSFVLPDDSAVPWSLTFLRLSDRVRGTALAQDILVWRGKHLIEVFRERDVVFDTALAHLRSEPLFKIPRVMALLAPESAADIPARFAVRGRTWRDWIECASTPQAVAQVLIPNDTNLGVTIFNEVSAHSQVRGCIAGEEICFSGRSTMEFIRHV
ncbi:MAG: hypothetical protein HY699_13895 [Deltaproteobacteria bacterium]|nr:hypothetical protein [Deltaproteobacteria bacterium]